MEGREGLKLDKTEAKVDMQRGIHVGQRERRSFCG